MAKSLIELFNESEYKDQIKKNTDKTPLSEDGGKDLIADEELVKKARGGDINTNKYSDTVIY